MKRGITSMVMLRFFVYLRTDFNPMRAPGIMAQAPITARNASTFANVVTAASALIRTLMMVVPAYPPKLISEITVALSGGSL